MKIYSTKNGKAVYVNNEQVLISDEAAKIIELFEYQIFDNENEIDAVKISTEKFMNALPNYSIENKSEDGCTIDFLIKDSNPVACIFNDPVNDNLNDRLDKKNTEAAYNDFIGWLSI